MASIQDLWCGEIVLDIIKQGRGLQVSAQLNLQNQVRNL